MFLGRATEWVKDFLFPVFCLNCGKEGGLLCKKCKRQIKFCPFVFCTNFASDKLLVMAFFSYNSNNIFQKMIKLWKYDGVIEIKDLWSWLIGKKRNFIKKFLSDFDTYENITIIPIPLHPRRLRERGFNQALILSEIIRKSLSSSSNINVGLGLQRVRYTSQQAKLTLSDRQKNLKSAFVWNQQLPVPKQVVLVDDVFTTGATANECIKVLRDVGVERIKIVVLAHG